MPFFSPPHYGIILFPITISLSSSSDDSRSWLTWNNCIYFCGCMSFKTFETPILDENRTDYEPFKLPWPSKNGPMGRKQYPQTFWVMVRTVFLSFFLSKNLPSFSVVAHNIRTETFSVSSYWPNCNQGLRAFLIVFIFCFSLRCSRSFALVTLSAILSKLEII